MPELRELALVVAALVDDRRAHVGLQPPADQVLGGVAERAEEEEVEDDDRGERRERDRRPAVRRTASSLLSPLERLGPPAPAAMNDEPRIASEISTEPISTERGVVSQPLVGARRWPRPARLSAVAGGGPGLERQDLLRHLEQRPAGRRRRRQPAVPGVGAVELDRVQVHERQVRQVAAARRPRPCAPPRPSRPRVLAVRAPISALS